MDRMEVIGSDMLNHIDSFLTIYDIVKVMCALRLTVNNCLPDVIKRREKLIPKMRFKDGCVTYIIKYGEIITDYDYAIVDQNNVTYTKANQLPSDVNAILSKSMIKMAKMGYWNKRTYKHCSSYPDDYMHCYTTSKFPYGCIKFFIAGTKVYDFRSDNAIYSPRINDSIVVTDSIITNINYKCFDLYYMNGVSYYHTVDGTFDPDTFGKGSGFDFIRKKHVSINYFKSVGIENLIPMDDIEYMNILNYINRILSNLKSKGYTIEL